MKILYEQIGGQKAVDAAVDIFYRKILLDDRVKDFFDDIDMDEQLKKQKGFLTFAFGGPNRYSGLNMKDGHGHLVKRGLNDSHVDVVIELLGETLRELEVPENLIGDVAAVAESVRNQVLGRS
jgi:hemoglobin